MCCVHLASTSLEIVTLLSISSSNSISVPDHRDCFQLPCNFISMSLKQPINFDDLIGIILVTVFLEKSSVVQDFQDV